jgi:ferritin
MEIKSLLNSSDRQLLDEAGEHELYASHFYKYAASQSQREGLFGAQKFFEKESADEAEHFYKVRDFANDMGDIVCTPALDEIKLKDNCLSCLLDAAYEMECDLLEFYSKMYNQAKLVSLKVFAQGMVEIQTKAVGEYGDLIARLSKCNEVLIFDQELGNK